MPASRCSPGRRPESSRRATRAASRRSRDRPRRARPRARASDRASALSGWQAGRSRPPIEPLHIGTVSADRRASAERSGRVRAGVGSRRVVPLNLTECPLQARPRDRSSGSRAWATGPGPDAQRPPRRCSYRRPGSPRSRPGSSRRLPPRATPGRPRLAAPHTASAPARRAPRRPGGGLRRARPERVAHARGDPRRVGCRAGAGRRLSAAVAPSRPLPALVPVSHDGGGSAIDRASFSSSALAGEGSFLVYLPPGYTSADRYPVIYLLHGQDGHATAFLEVGLQQTLDRLIERGAIPPMIAVMIQDRSTLEQLAGPRQPAQRDLRDRSPGTGRPHAAHEGHARRPRDRRQLEGRLRRHARRAGQPISLRGRRELARLLQPPGRRTAGGPADPLTARPARIPLRRGGRSGRRSRGGPGVRRRSSAQPVRRPKAPSTPATTA